MASVIDPTFCFGAICAPPDAGKTAFLHRFVRGEFVDNDCGFATISKAGSKTVEIDDRRVTIQGKRSGLWYAK